MQLHLALSTNFLRPFRMLRKVERRKDLSRDTFFFLFEFIVEERSNSLLLFNTFMIEAGDRVFLRKVYIEHPFLY